jgi:hypothetical protein
MAYARLKAKHRSLRDGFHSNSALRTHRASSWLDRAEQSADDVGSQFIFLWISFNAAYATDIDEQYRSTERACLSLILRSWWISMWMIGFII